LRTSVQALSKATTDAERIQHASDLYRTAHKLTGGANVTGHASVAQLSEAIEALLTELHEKPANINASNIRTIASAVDFLPALFEHATRSGRQETPTSNILVVDDEPIARKAVSQALDRAKLKSVGVDDASAALKMLEENSYDLVFLDVDMPLISGHELCSKLRALPRHKSTPVVFVTSNTDLKNRANSTISGGNDFIGKPFHFLELAVKSLVYVMRGKIQPQKQA
jgi:PleD family two-component response regulator